MKKHIILMVVFLLFLVGCDALTTTTTSPETTTLAPTTTTSTKTLTTENKSAVIEAEFAFLSAFIPAEITEDFILPELMNDQIDATFYQDEKVIDTIFSYEAHLEPVTSLLKIELSYQGLTLFQIYEIEWVENESEYYANLKTETFNEVVSLLDDSIPLVIGHDMPMPNIDIEGVNVTYSVDHSEIYRDYFIFTFPTTEQLFNLTVQITFMNTSFEKTYTIKMKALDDLFQIPQMHIETFDGMDVTDKESYVDANLSLTAFTSNHTPIPLLDEVPMSIRARGNSTLWMPKKSYRIKLETKSTMLFHHSENDWVLLANFSDQTLIRNYLAHELSRDMDMAFSPAAAFVDVYLNGEYQGNYLLTDQVEVTNDRVDIEEHSYDMDTGYLIEMDKRMYDWPEGVLGQDYFFIYGVPYVIKSPKTDSMYFSQDQFNYIESYIATVHLALMNQSDYDHLIEIDTFVDWFIIQELFKNVDSGYSSVYMYKDKGGLLKMGPIWDFDLSTGNPGHLQDDLRVPEGWYTSLDFKNIWFNYLMEYEDFRTRLKARWNELYDTEIQAVLARIYPTANSIAKSRYLNFETWDVIGSWQDWYTAPEILAADTYAKQLAFLYDYLLIRSLWLDEAINALDT